MYQKPLTFGALPTFEHRVLCFLTRYVIYLVYHFKNITQNDMNNIERIFISSTCYDLIDARAELEAFLNKQGFNVILSDSMESEFQLEHSKNSIETCLSNVRNSDCLVVILSQRYGPLLKIIDNDRSATHLEYLEAKKRNLPIFMYVRDRLDAEYRIWKNNKDATDLNFVWCKDRNAKQLFSFIDDHHTIKDNHSNWYWSFRNTPDLKSRIARDLQIHIRHHEAKTFLAGKLSKFIRDNLSGIIEKRAGIHLQIEPGKELETWQKNLIGMLHALFVKQAEDVSVTWLRPTQNGVRRLILYRDKNFLKQPHYEFGENEGFAGKVWSQGKAQLSSPTFQHKWWEYRECCENSTYICAPVGDFKSSGGILAVGSDAGFNTTEFDLEIVSIFASILALSCEGEAIHADIRLVSSK